MSISPVTAGWAAIAGKTVTEGNAGEEPEAGMSSYCADGPLLFNPRFNLIFESCRSSSNSVMEFFFIKSMMAFISFKSTGRFR
jgi:hypothetical protein